VTKNSLPRQNHLSKIFSEIIEKLNLDEVFNGPGRPCFYSTQSIIKAFLIMVAFRLTSVRSLARFLAEHSEISQSCQFSGNRIPSYRTFCRRFGCLDNWVLQWSRIIITFLIETGILKLKILIIDGTPCQSRCKKPKGNQMAKNSDPEARFGCANWGKDWFFGYKSLILASAKPLIIPLAWQVIPANQQETNHLIPLVSKASWLLEEGKEYELLGDSSFDSIANFNWCRQLNIRLTGPLKMLGRPKKEKTSKFKFKGERLKRWRFYKSQLGQKIYQRRTDIERLNGHLKDLFLIDPFPVRRLKNVNTYLSLAMLCYLAGVYYNFTNGRKLKEIKSLIA
jgi:hypothetical protein